MNLFTNTRRSSQRSAPPQPRTFSQYSTPAVPDSAWASEDFMLGAGMVIIQPATHKVVVIYETQRKFWFLPRGRKDFGESLEQTALREAHEESGYRVKFLPLFIPSNAPTAPNDQDARRLPNTEPFYITLTSWGPRRNRRGEVDSGGEYLTSWWVGQIPEDATPEPGTGMPDEQNFVAHLLGIEEALDRVTGAERHVVRYAWLAYVKTLEIYEVIRKEEEARQHSDTRDAEANLDSSSIAG